MVKKENLAELFLNNQGIVPTRKLNQAGISNYQIRKLLSERKITRVSRGNYIYNEFYLHDYEIISSLFPEAIIYLESALLLHEYTDRIPNESKIAIQRDIPNQQMIVLFLQEEFSRRLGKSNYLDQLILKGGFLLFSLGAGDTRATMDSDYLMKNLANEKESVESVIEEIIAIDNTGNITFELINMEIITEQNDYHGFRIKLIGIIGRTRTPVFIDLGVGDIIVPESELIRLETIIDGFQNPEIRSYSMETIIAEKLDAILYLMEASSRMKDFYDLYYLALSKKFDGAILKEAIYTTFKNRGHLNLIKNIH